MPVASLPTWRLVKYKTIVNATASMTYKRRCGMDKRPGKLLGLASLTTGVPSTRSRMENKPVRMPSATTVAARLANSARACGTCATCNTMHGVLLWLNPAASAGFTAQHHTKLKALYNPPLDLLERWEPRKKAG